MLLSAGMSLESFRILWRQAMWASGDRGVAGGRPPGSNETSERARLVLELGRAETRETGKGGPFLVCYAVKSEPPFAEVRLHDAPTDPSSRAVVARQIAGFGATEVYVLFTLLGARVPEPSYLLCSWGESATGEEASWLMPFRWRGKALEESVPLLVPDVQRTEVSRRLRGLVAAPH